MSWYDHGMPVINDPDVLATAELIRRLYAMPGCELGGPLHAMLDDGNIDDEQIDGDYYRATDGRTIETYLCKHRMAQVGTAWRHVYDDELCCTPEVADLARLILASFRRMSEPWRAAAIAWADGTIAQNLPILVDNWETACTASPQQVDDLVSDLRRWVSQGDAPQQKPCVSIPCPPWEGGDEASGNATERKPVFRWAEIHGDLNKLREEHRERLGAMPAWQGIAWAHYQQCLTDMLTHGHTHLQEGPDGSAIRWERLPPDGLCDDPTPRYRAVIDPPPQVDVEQMLLLDADCPPQVLYRGGPMLPSVQAMLERWLADPDWDTEAAPLIVGVPDGTSPEELGEAIKLCQRAGLFPATPNGILYLPEEADL